MMPISGNGPSVLSGGIQQPSGNANSSTVNPTSGTNKTSSSMVNIFSIHNNIQYISFLKYFS